MKAFYIICILLISSISFASAQHTTVASDSLLLDYYQNQRFADAADYLKQTYPEPINDAKLLAKLAYTTKMAAKLPDAETYYKRMYDMDTTSLTSLYNMGEITMRRGNNTKAILYFKKILLRDTANFNVYKQLADLSQNTGNIPAALSYMQKANIINPQNPDMAYDLSNYFINLKLYSNAEDVINKALAADSANLLLLKGKAQVDYALKKYPETIIATKQLIANGEQTGSIISMLGTSYYMIDKYNDCITTFKALEDGGTASEATYYYTAMSYKALHNQRKAITYLDRAIHEAISSGVSAYYSEKGDSYQRLKQLNNAAEAYQKSLLYNASPITYYAIANLYDTELKNKALAAKYYRKYLATKPAETQKVYIDYSKNRISALAR